MQQAINRTMLGCEPSEAIMLTSLIISRAHFARSRKVEPEGIIFTATSLFPRGFKSLDFPFLTTPKLPLPRILLARYLNKFNGY